jgi:hypothetical protein
MTGQDEQEKKLLEAIDRGFMWGYGPVVHRVFLAVTSLGGGSIGFYFLYSRVLKQIHPAPFPFWFLAMEWAIPCAGMLLMAEGIWRVSRYIDSAERDSAIYLIKRGINPLTLTKMKMRYPAKKG